MPDNKIIALEKELERLRLEPAGLELASVLNKLAFALLHSDPRRAEDYAMEVLDLAEKQRFPAEQANSYRILGTINLEKGNFAEAMLCCRKSIEIYEELGDRSGVASVHGTIATAYRSQGLVDKALEH